MWFNEFFLKKILFVKIAPPWSHCPPSRMHSHWGIQKYEQNSSWHYKKYVLGQVFWYTVAAVPVVPCLWCRARPTCRWSCCLAAVWFHKKQGWSWIPDRKGKMMFVLFDLGFRSSDKPSPPWWCRAEPTCRWSCCLGAVWFHKKLT